MKKIASELWLFPTNSDKPDDLASKSIRISSGIIGMLYLFRNALYLQN